MRLPLGNGRAGDHSVDTRIDKAHLIEAADIVAAGITPTLKFGVTEDALYQLNPDDLTGARFDLSGVTLSTIKISNQGAESSIYVHGSDSDHAFNGNDYILSYGTAITDMYTTKDSDAGPIFVTKGDHAPQFDSPLSADETVGVEGQCHELVERQRPEPCPEQSLPCPPSNGSKSCRSNKPIVSNIAETFSLTSGNHSSPLVGAGHIEGKGGPVGRRAWIF